MIPNAADVLSSLFISVAGVACLCWVHEQDRERALLAPGIFVVGVGLVLTGLASAFYHWHPTDAALVWDRSPMTIVFSGMLLSLWSSATLTRATWIQCMLVVTAALGTVWFWIFRGSLWPYALLQYGGIFAVLYLVIRKRVLGAQAWRRILEWYALAKVFDYLDQGIWVLSGHLVSGHTLKHLTSAAAGFALLWLAKKSHFISTR